MKITCRVSLFARGGVGSSNWIPIGFRKVGEREWDVMTEAGEKIGRCWGPENMRMFSFGTEGHTGFHLERLATEKQWDVADPWVVAAERASDNTVDVSVAPPDDEAQPHFTPEAYAKRIRERADYHAKVGRESEEIQKRKARARLSQSFSDSHRDRALRKIHELQEKLEKESPT